MTRATARRIVDAIQRHHNGQPIAGYITQGELPALRAIVEREGREPVPVTGLTDVPRELTPRLHPNGDRPFYTFDEREG